MKRGELWWADVDKRRPVVLLSRPEAYAVRAAVIVAPTSTKVRGLRSGSTSDGVSEIRWRPGS
jgi:mRNA interferase MazF